jgi:TfoX/Sxy family transcriptional regulator of competence genes
MAYDEALAQRIRDLLNGPDVEERKMFGGLTFLVGGRMCCGVQDTDLMVRVPKEGHAQALRQPHVRPMDFTGRSLKGFVYVSDTGTKSAAALRRWVTLGREVATQAATPAARATRRDAGRS